MASAATRDAHSACRRRDLIGEDAFDAAIGAGALAVAPPDVAKWGGISGCWPVIERIRAAGLRYCPHYLGGGVGLLAATGSTGWLEIDANINPLRTFPQCLPRRYRRRQRAARRVCRHRQSTSTWRGCPPSAPPPELSIHLRRTGRRRETPAIAAPAPRVCGTEGRRLSSRIRPARDIRQMHRTDDRAASDDTLRWNRKRPEFGRVSPSVTQDEPG
jgi:hypothetical protein